MSMRKTLLTAALIVFALPLTASAAPVIFQAAGANAAAIQAQVDAFLAQIGSPNNGNNPGPLAGGRREINWDGGGATTSATAGPLFTGFQNTRGGTFTTPGIGFAQATLLETVPTDTTLGEIVGNATYATTFSTFSPLRIFTPLGSNILDATFSIPGTSGAAPAVVSGFGSVFSDVDLANVTSMEFFDAVGQTLGTYYVPAFAGNQTLSFLGVYFNAGEQISRVRITNGNSALGPNDGGGIDVVVMDDFFYSEPQAAPVPEPATMILLGTGLAGIAAGARRRRKAAKDAEV